MFRFVTRTHAAFLFYRPEAGNTKSREHHATSSTKSLQPLIGWRWQYLRRRIRLVGFLPAQSVISPARTQVWTSQFSPCRFIAPPLHNVGVEVATFGGTACDKTPRLPSTPWYQLSAGPKC
jgi:hypothetical protein